MADIRIKDLTTTASSTASGDFFVIDGTTGTRKVNAFNPSFGGSATLTGTLTVNGTGNSSFAGQLIQVADPATISLWKDATPTKAARFQFNTLADNGFSLGVYDGSSWFNAITVAPTTGVVKIPSSSASSSTITGALVVSGGVGVAGKVTSTALGLANTSQSATAWGDVGIQLSVAGAVLTDTSSSGTVGRIVTNSIAASALAASSTTTYTAAASLFIAGAPTANTNVTITNAYALYTAGGRINFQGLPTSSAGLQAGTLWNDAGTLKIA